MICVTRALACLHLSFAGALVQLYTGIIAAVAAAVAEIVGVSIADDESENESSNDEGDNNASY